MHVCVQRTVLKFSAGDVQAQKRLLTDFVAQWSHVELLALLSHVEERHGKEYARSGSPHVAAALTTASLESLAAASAKLGPKHTFNSNAREWLDLFDSNHVSLQVLCSDFVILDSLFLNVLVLRPKTVSSR